MTQIIYNKLLVNRKKFSHAQFKPQIASNSRLIWVGKSTISKIEGKKASKAISQSFHSITHG
jgi:hypothetical protein